MNSGTRAFRRARATLARTGAPCWLCGQPIDYTLPRLDPMAYQADHVMPRAHGGGDQLDNLRPSHRRCNRAKGDKLQAPVLRRSGSLDR